MKHKSLLFCLLTLLAYSFSCSQMPVQNKQENINSQENLKVKSPSTYTYDKKNPKDNEFPGGRGTDQMIVYTPEFGEKTGTNEYGTEAVISAGIVIANGQNNSEIPEDGFVISGHNKAKDWILKNLTPGVKVEINFEKKEVKATRDIESMKYEYSQIDKEIKQNLESLAEKKMEPSKEFQSLYKKAALEYKDAEILLQQKDKPQTMRLFDESLTTLKKSYGMTMPVRKNEIRGIWYRLIEKNPAELEKTVKKLKDAGFNTIFPETIYYGTSICPPPADFLEQNPYFKGWDPLASLIEIAHKNNMEVHAWAHVFFAGFKYNPTEIPHNSPIIDKHPEWLAIAKDGEKESRSEKGYYYISPSNDEARKSLETAFANLIKKYDLDGFQFDYIRYSFAEPIEFGYDYSQIARDKFKKQYGIDPIDISSFKDPAAYEKWNKFREGEITSFIAEVSAKLRETKPGIKLSAAVFADKKEAVKMKFQNWPLWCNRKYVDFICPMAYYEDIAKIGEVTKNIREEIGDGAGIATGILVSPETTDIHMLKQIREIQENGSDGIAVFSLNLMDDKVIQMLKYGPFRE